VKSILQTQHTNTWYTHMMKIMIQAQPVSCKPNKTF